MRLFLSDKCLQGLYPLDRKKALANQAYFSRSEHLERALDKAADLGVRDILCTAQPLLFQLLAREPKRWPFRLFAVVPDFQKFVRDTSHYGTAGAAARKVLAMPLLKKFGLGLVSMRHWKRVLAMRFDIMMNLFLMAESSQFSPFFRSGRVGAVLIHPQITDLSLAFGQGGLFATFAEIVRGQFGCEPGACTVNFARLNETLSRGGISLPWISAPFNPRGYGMNPDARACESLLGRPEPAPSVIADGWRLSGALPFDQGLSYLRSHPFRGATLELEDLVNPALDGPLAQICDAS